MMFNRRRMDQGRSHRRVINRERHYRVGARWLIYDVFDKGI